MPTTTPEAPPIPEREAPPAPAPEPRPAPQPSIPKRRSDPDLDPFNPNWPKTRPTPEPKA